MRRFGLVFALVLLAGSAQAFGSIKPTAEAKPGVWLSTDEVAALPTEGPAWDAVRAAARTPTLRPDLSNQDDVTNVRVLAKALVAARTGDPRLRAEVAQHLTPIEVGRVRDHTDQHVDIRVGTLQGGDAAALLRRQRAVPRLD